MYNNGCSEIQDFISIKLLKHWTLEILVPNLLMFVFLYIYVGLFAFFFTTDDDEQAPGCGPYPSCCHCDYTEHTGVAGLCEADDVAGNNRVGLPPGVQCESESACLSYTAGDATPFCSKRMLDEE
eukprot:SAG22_NODE_387_length_11302_cov_333.169597_5_plen_125_part_00